MLFGESKWFFYGIAAKTPLFFFRVYFYLNAGEVYVQCNWKAYYGVGVFLNHVLCNDY